MFKTLLRVFVDGLIDYDEKVASSSSKNSTRSRLECKDHTLLVTKLTKIDTLFLTKMAKNTYPLRLHIPIDIAHIREYFLPAGIQLLCNNY